jgi:DNA polymerase-3 subunit chi
MCAEVFFYHVAGSGPAAVDDVLPDLLGKILENRRYAVVVCPTSGRMLRLDDLLWTYRDASFLPHGVVGAFADADQHTGQPILLLAADTDGAELLLRQMPAHYIPVLLASAEPLLNVACEHAGEGRVIYIFSSSDADVSRARDVFRRLKTGGQAPVYWQQTDKGWHRKAS